VVLIVLDDMGFADLDCYGSRIATPHIGALANGGLRYNRFHVTALCSPTRACLLTGRNQHPVGMGFLAGLSMGFPGYSGRIPKSAATLSRVLRDAGYRTFAVGKWHLTSSAEVGLAGSFDHWPLGMGFERYYGFVGGAVDQWRPELVRDNSPVDQPRPGNDYHLTEDLAAQAIRFLHDQQHAAPGRPFFLYFATGAMHAPHQVGSTWIASYRGKFDDGWDAMRGEVFARQQQFGVVPPDAQLTPRPSWVAPWDELANEERRLYARMMEVYAGFLTHTDAQIGRVLGYLSELGMLDNTLVLLVSDNGASAEGGPHGYLRYGFDDNVASMLSHIDEFGGDGAQNHYAWGWAWAGNTPFRLWKRYSWLGGVRVPLVVHWPAGIPADCAGQVHSQFCHAIDLMPTILDAAGVTVPETVDGVSQRPLDGTSIVTTFADADSPNLRRTQYFETVGSRAIYHDGWKATTNHVDTGFPPEVELIEGSLDFESDRWSLFHLDEDFSEATDLAALHPDRLQQLVELWWSEAGRNQVLPLISGLASPERFAAAEPPEVRDRYVYLPGGGPIITPSAFLGHLSVDIEVRNAHDIGGIVCVNHAHGEGFHYCAGWSCYIVEGRLILGIRDFDGHPHRIVSESPALSGKHEIGISLLAEENPNGRTALAIRLTIDGREVGAGRIAFRGNRLLERVLPPQWIFSQGKLLFGRDPGPAMSDDYEPPFPFTGSIDRAVFTMPSLPEPTNFRDEVETALRHE
jgi:arylsulfatase